MSISKIPEWASFWARTSSTASSIPLSVAITKRSIDLFFSTLGLLLFGVLLPFLALAIYFDNPGPIFYRQRRSLLLRSRAPNGRCSFEEFSMLKLRSMRLDAERSEE